ncbi:MAG: hypothetical protein AAFQ87_16095, partial [Bacteroidota bacterium]
MKEQQTYTTYAYGIIFLLLCLPLSIFAQPAVDLGPDQVACAPVTLDAGNPSAISYSWSTGGSQQTETVNTSAWYWVDVTDAGGTSRDSVYIDIQTAPSTPQLSDTTVCSGPDVLLTAMGAADQIAWFDVASGGSPLAFGRTRQNVCRT